MGQQNFEKEALPECTTCGTRYDESGNDLSRKNRFKNYQQNSRFRRRKQDVAKTGLRLFLDSVDWTNIVLLGTVPVMALYGIITQPFPCWQTCLLWAFFYYATGFAITGGYHRCFAHKSYKASWPLRVFWLCFGAGAVQGSCKWWSMGHRAHHRYTDTEKDPYNSLRGFFYAHIGWLLLKQDHERIGRVNIDDLKKDPLIRFQHRHFLSMAVFFAILLPALIAHFGWNDFWGGFFFPGWVRLTICQHCTFFVNSLAHYWGATSYDDVLTPRDSIVTAFLTLGEGYHNFHHEFPNDYRNGIRWYQYDPTKWIIRACSWVGLAYDLQKFPENEIQKGKLTMQQKKLTAKQRRLNWGVRTSNLPTWTQEDLRDEVAKNPERKLIVINNIVHDVTEFQARHPGGARYFDTYCGKDATAEFDGTVYNHTSAARNILSHFRVANVDTSEFAVNKRN